MRKLMQGERRYLEHAQRERDQGKSLAEYCRQAGLNAQTFYNANSTLRRKKSSAPATALIKARKSSDFPAVRIAPWPVRTALGIAGSSSPSGHCFRPSVGSRKATFASLQIHVCSVNVRRLRKTQTDLGTKKH
jgi:hypothetical protein